MAKDPCSEISTSGWNRLEIGDRIDVAKLSPAGAEVARYSADIVATQVGDDWLIVRATYTYRQVDLDGLSFVPGDVLLEWFSPVHDFNAFAVFSAAGQFRGWYANVTRPPRLDGEETPPVIAWLDLYVDLLGRPDGTFTILDEDELSESELTRADPLLFARILAAQRELVRRYELGLLPFDLVRSQAAVGLPLWSQTSGTSGH